jgi:hypothetical protein
MQEFAVAIITSLNKRRMGRGPSPAGVVSHDTRHISAGGIGVTRDRSTALQAQNPFVEEGGGLDLQPKSLHSADRRRLGFKMTQFKEAVRACGNSGSGAVHKTRARGATHMASRPLPPQSRTSSRPVVSGNDDSFVDPNTRERPITILAAVLE